MEGKTGTVMVIKDLDLVERHDGGVSTQEVWRGTWRHTSIAAKKFRGVSANGPTQKEFAKEVWSFWPRDVTLA